MDLFPGATIANSPDSGRGHKIFIGAAREQCFAAALTGSFLLLAMLGALHHEMWRDELHGWLVARDNTNLWNVFQVTRYEAHFVLWRVFLFGITRVTHNPLTLQFFNVLLATAAIWIVARFSPFRKLEKCLLSFGYFFFYEYCIIAQDYTMIVLLVVCFCALYPGRARNALSLSATLFLLANAAPYGFLIALIFSALLVFDSARNPEDRRSLRNATKLRVAVLIVLTGLVCATLQLLLMKVGPSTSWKHPFTAAGVADTMLNVLRTYVPITWGFPYWSRWTWGINLIDANEAGLPVLANLSLLLGLVTLSLALVVVSVGLLLKRPSALFLYLVGTASLLLIQFLVNSGALRHKAFLFILFVASLWIGSESPEWQLSSIPLRRLGDFFGRWRIPFVTSVLLIQMIAGVYAYTADWIYPFSGSKQMAQFLRDSGLASLPIVGDLETHVAPLSAYLDKPIYYLPSSRFGTYADQSVLQKGVSGAPVLKESLQLAQQMRSDVVLVHVWRTQDEASTLPSVRINADGFVVPSSAPDLASCATSTLMGRFGSHVDEFYNVYLIQFQTGKHEDAVGYWEHALRLKPKYAPAHYFLANALFQRGQVQEAIDHYQQAVRLIPDYAESHYNLGLAWHRVGRLPEAIEQYEQALRLKPYPDAHNNLGAGLTEAGKPQDAIEHFEQALRLRPDYAEAHNNLGMALAQLGRMPEAIAHWEEALRIRPDIAEAHYSLGIALTRLNRLPEAIMHYEQVVRLEPDSAGMHYNLGVVLEQAGRVPEAIEQYQQAVRLKPDFTDAQNGLVRLRAAR